MLGENGERIWEKSTHYYINNLSLSESVMVNTEVHILQSTYILQSTNYIF